MEPAQTLVYQVIESIVPQPVQLARLPQDVRLNVLGFDSMALVSLLVELEDKLGLSMEQLTRCLHRACTLGALLQICCGGLG